MKHLNRHQLRDSLTSKKVFSDWSMCWLVFRRLLMWRVDLRNLKASQFLHGVCFQKVVIAADMYAPTNSVMQANLCGMVVHCLALSPHSKKFVGLKLVWCLHIPHVPAWVSFLWASFLLQIKDMQIKSTDYTKLPTSVNVCGNGCLCYLEYTWLLTRNQLGLAPAL